MLPVCVSSCLLFSLKFAPGRLVAASLCRDCSCEGQQWTPSCWPQWSLLQPHPNGPAAALGRKRPVPQSPFLSGTVACLPSWNIFFLKSQNKALSFCLRATCMLNQTLKFTKSDPELTSCATVTLLLPYLPLPFHKLSHLSSWWLHTCSCSWKKTVVQSPFTLHIQFISELIWLYHDYDRLWPLLSSSTATKLPSLHFWLIKRVCPLPHPISLLLSLLKTSLKAISRVILVKFKSFPQSIS